MGRIHSLISKRKSRSHLAMDDDVMQEPEPTPIPNIEDIQAQRRKHGLDDIDSSSWRTFTYEQPCGEATVFYQDGMVVEDIKAWTAFEVLSCGRCLAIHFLLLSLLTSGSNGSKASSGNSQNRAKKPIRTIRTLIHCTPLRSNVLMTGLWRSWQMSGTRPENTLTDVLFFYVRIKQPK